MSARRGPNPGGLKRRETRKELLNLAVTILRETPMSSEQLALAMKVCDSSGRRFMGLMAKAEAAVPHSEVRSRSRKVIVWQLGTQEKVNAFLADVEAGAFPSPSPVRKPDFTPRVSINKYEHDPIMLHLFAGRWPALEKRAH